MSDPYLRHARYYSRVCREIDELCKRGSERITSGLEYFDQEWPNIEVAVRWVERHIDHDREATDLIVQFLTATENLFRIRPDPDKMILITRGFLLLGQNGSTVKRSVSALRSARRTLSYAYFRKGNLVEAERVAHDQVNEDRSIGQPFTLAGSLRFKAFVCKAQSRFKEAEGLYESALKIHEAEGTAESEEAAFLLHDQACLFKGQGRFEEAEPQLKRALALFEASRGPRHPGAVHFLHSLADFYTRTNRPVEAEPFASRAVKIREDVLGVDHPETAISVVELAKTFRDQKRYEEAEEHFRRALTIQDRFAPLGHPTTAAFLCEFGRLHLQRGQLRRALPLCLRALSIQEKVLPQNHFDIAATLELLVCIYGEMGLYDDIVPRLERVYKIRKRVLGPGHPETFDCLNRLLMVKFYLCSVGRHDRREFYLYAALHTLRLHALKVGAILSVVRQSRKGVFLAFAIMTAVGLVIVEFTLHGPYHLR